MEFKLNEDQQMIHDLAKDFAESVLQPRIDEIEAGEMTEVSNGEKHPQLPHDIHQQLAECGFIGISFPEEYNGLGMGHVEQAIVIKELSRISPSVGKCLDVYILGLEALDLYASPEQKEKYLAPCCSGEQTVSFAFTEPDTGSDPKMLKTRLEKQADGTYKLNGVKRFISNAGYDGPCVLFALQKDEESGKDLVTGLVIDKFCEGYSISSPWEKIGYRGSEVYDIFLDDVKVTEDQILGKPGDGFTQLLGTTAYGKLGFTAVFVGTALGAADIALKYCQEKLHRGKSITKFPTTQLRLSTMLTLLTPLSCCCWRLLTTATTTTSSPTTSPPCVLFRPVPLRPRAMPPRPLPRLLLWPSTPWALTVSATSIRPSASCVTLLLPPTSRVPATSST